MNLAQIAMLNERGRISYRTELSPGPWLLAYELGRMPKRPARAAAPSVPRPVLEHEQEQSGELTELAVRMLAALRAAWRNREKLGFAELCERVGCSRSNGANRVLDHLHHRGLVHRDGSNRGSVYWAEEQKRAA